MSWIFFRCLTQSIFSSHLDMTSLSLTHVRSSTWSWVWCSPELVTFSFNGCCSLWCSPANIVIINHHNKVCFSSEGRTSSLVGWVVNFPDFGVQTSKENKLAKVGWKLVMSMFHTIIILSVLSTWPSPPPSPSPASPWSSSSSRSSWNLGCLSSHSQVSWDSRWLHVQMLRDVGWSAGKSFLQIMKMIMRIWWWRSWLWWWDDYDDDGVDNDYHLVWYDKNGGKGGDGNGEKKKQFPTQRRRVGTRTFCFSILLTWSTAMARKVALFWAWLWGCRTWRLARWRPSWNWRFGRSCFCVILYLQVGDEKGEVATSFLFCNLEKRS